MTQPILTETSLGDRISEFKAKMAQQAPPKVVATLGAELRKLADSGIAAGALAVGGIAPTFTLPDARGRPTSLMSFSNRHSVVVTFYRGGWCPFCDLQLRSYERILPEIHKMGAELIAISPQTPDFAFADIEDKQLTFPVLTDEGNRVAREYGLVYSLSEPLRELQKGFGNAIPKFNGDDSWELPMPGTFVLDRNRIVVLAHVDPDYTNRLEPAALLHALQGVRT
jgi:peroxiredoxin